MKRIAIALLATAAVLAANSARADTRVSIGVNVGGPAYRPVPPAVVYAPTPSVVYAPPHAVVVAPSHGYWKDVQVKTWVPERWVVRTIRWGRSERFCEPGYYTYTTNRVWVDGRSDHRHGYSYGYGHNHRDDHRDNRHDNHNRYDNRGWNR
jgi:hypothetical protein